MKLMGQVKKVRRSRSKSPHMIESSGSGEKTCVVELAGKEYTVRHPGLLEDAAWRESASRLFGDVASGMGDRDLKTLDLSKVIPIVMGRAPYALIELMFLYCPEMSADRIEILEGVEGEEELLAAAVKVFEFSGPKLKKMISQAHVVTLALSKGLG